MQLEAGNAAMTELGKTLGPTGTSFLIRRELGVDRGSSRPGHDGAPALSSAAVRCIALRKLPDLDTDDLDAAIPTVSGTARSMGVRVSGPTAPDRTVRGTPRCARAVAGVN